MEIGDKIRLTTTGGGSIPGIPPGDYYVVAKNATGKIAIASTPDGQPLVPTGPIVGQPIFQTASLKYAYPLKDSAWLSLSLEDYLKLSLNEYLSLDVM